MRQITVIGNRVLPEAEAALVRAQVSASMREKSQQREQERLDRRTKRLAHSPERLSVAKAMFSVERHIVKALWTLSRLPGDRGNGFSSQHGIAYMLEPNEKWGNAVAGGGWLSTPPRPEAPSAKSIDAMYEPLTWLSLIERDQAKLLTEGAMYRRGSMANNISWPRIRAKFPQYQHLTVRTLQRRYEQALRDIVSELALAR